MRRFVFAVAAMIGSYGVMQAQSISDEDLISKLKINRELFADLDQGPSLKQKAVEQNHDISIEKFVTGTSSICSDCPQTNPTDHPLVKRATKAADLVVVGKIIRNTSALTSNEAFIITDSQFHIDEVWYSRPSSSNDVSPTVGTEITVVSPGGVIRSAGHVVRASLSSHKPFRVGHEYLLYLKFVPQSSSYRSAGLDGFDVSLPQVSSLAPNATPPAQELMQNKIIFLQAMRASTLRAVKEMAQ